MPFLARLGALAGLAGLTAVAACSAPSAATSDDDLTSVTARARSLELGGVVYVAPDASEETIVTAVRAQAQTAFGPLRTTNIAVNSRELRAVDASTFVKRPVTVVDTDAPAGSAVPMLEVRYTYRDDAVVGLEHATRSQVPLALMTPGYATQAKRILAECTSGDQHARDFVDTSAWYVFEPRLPKCQEAMRAEQAKIDADRAKLAHPTTEVAKSDVTRLYLPIQAKLGADKTNDGKSYPDYHRLFRGGVQPDKLVVSLVYGFLDHDPEGLKPAVSDYNWGELVTTLDLVLDSGPEVRFAKVPPQTPAREIADLSRFRLASGKVVEGASFADLVHLRDGRTRLDLTADEKKDLEKQLAEAMARKWVAVERPLKVQIGDEPPRDFAVELLIYFGADVISGPHAFAAKNSDVFFYNGHSSLGYGPLDPKNFRKGDLAPGYQIFWIDSCVSYNYYEKDYVPLKERGTKDLDLITNGLEAPSFRSGLAMGRFLVKLLDGSGASYRELLLAAKDTEALRVVDGELDNEFTPERYPLRVTPR